MAAILASLEAQCKEDYPRQPEKIAICDKIAAVKVQIPPGVFDGLESLDWPIPLGLCATLGECQLPCCAAGAGPEQIHLSLSGFGDMSRMGVSWVDLDGAASAVQWRAAAGGSTLSAAGTILPGGTVTLQTPLHPAPSFPGPIVAPPVVPSVSCSPPLRRVWSGQVPGTGWAGWLGTIHRAVMTDLAPDTPVTTRLPLRDELFPGG